jgi:hypothetical protein
MSTVNLNISPRGPDIRVSQGMGNKNDIPCRPIEPGRIAGTKRVNSRPVPDAGTPLPEIESIICLPFETTPGLTYNCRVVLLSE